MRSTVDLPQPDGPTRATNCPFSMERLKSLTATTSSKTLRVPSKETKGGMSAGPLSGELHLTAPMARPRTRWRCMRRMKTRMGRLMPMVPAADSDQ